MTIKQFLTIDELALANRVRNKLWDPDRQIGLSFRGLELGGEAGEVLNKIKKLERERMGLRGSRTTIEALAEELADVVICVSLICNDADIDLAHAIAAKFNDTSVANGFPVAIGVAGQTLLNGKVVE